MALEAIEEGCLTGKLSPDEHARRQAALDWARHNIWLSGFTLDEDAEALFARYVRGEITREELNAAVLAMGGVTPPDASR